jgi:hypothetical protein
LGTILRNKRFTTGEAITRAKALLPPANGVGKFYCIIVLKDVPADICENCGEYYLSQSTTAAVLDRAERAIDRNAEVEILRFAA